MLPQQDAVVQPLQARHEVRLVDGGRLKLRHEVVQLEEHLPGQPRRQRRQRQHRPPSRWQTGQGNTTEKMTT